MRNITSYMLALFFLLAAIVVGGTVKRGGGLIDVLAVSLFLCLIAILTLKPKKHHEPGELRPRGFIYQCGKLTGRFIAAARNKIK